MSWSLKLRNGDLDLGGPGGFATCSGQNKLIQDLRCWLLEPRGTDAFHPDYGSTLDGGTLPDGTDMPSPIGNLFTGEDLLRIESEVRRILNAYQQQQADRLGRDSMLYQGKNTMDRGEILIAVDDVAVFQMGDTAIVNISITTADGDNINFTQPIV